MKKKISKRGTAYYDIFRMNSKESKSIAAIRLPLRSQYDSREEDYWNIGAFSIGVKCFEGPDKLSFYAVVNDWDSKKIVYRWIGAIKLTKNNVNIYINLIERSLNPKKRIFASTNNHPQGLIAAIAKHVRSSGESKKLGKVKMMLAVEKKINYLIYKKIKQVKPDFKYLNKRMTQLLTFKEFIYLIRNDIPRALLFYKLKSTDGHMQKIKKVAIYDMPSYEEKRDVKEVKVTADNRKRKIYHGRRKKDFIQKSKNWKDLINKCFNHNGKELVKLMTEFIFDYRESINEVSGYTAESGAELVTKIIMSSYLGMNFAKLKLLAGLCDLGITIDEFKNIIRSINEKKEIIKTEYHHGPEPYYAGMAAHRVDRFIRDIRIIALLNGFSKERKLKFVREILLDTEQNKHLMDALYQWERCKDKIIIPNTINTLQDLHDYVSKEYIKLQHAPFDLKFNEEVVALDNVVIEGMK